MADDAGTATATAPGENPAVVAGGNPVGVPAPAARDLQAETGVVEAVGARVKSLREGAGFSLRDLAERCGVSATMLSQVERGQTSPTLSVAAKIAFGLDLSLSQLLRLDEAPHVVVSRAADHRRQTRGSHRIEELTPPLPGLRVDVSAHELDPGGSTGGSDDRPMHEPGSRETAVVLEGELVLVADRLEYRLATGDSVTFDADLPHQFQNQSQTRTRFIAVIAAGLRRG